MKKLEDRDWWPELVELKDVMSLRELSAKFGAAPAAISNALKRNGLKRNPAPPGPRAKRDPSYAKASGGATAKKKAAKKAAPKKTARKAAPKKAAAKAPVAKKAAPKKAAKKAAPKKAAPKKAAAKAAPAAAKRRGGRGGSSRIEPFKDRLGKEVDRVIAAEAGVSVSAVTNYRKRHGIKAASKRGGARKRVEATAPAAAKASPAPKAAPKAAKAAKAPKAAKAAKAPKASTGGFGYRVSIGGSEYVVVASDIAEAAARALSAKRGAVTGIELLGSAING